MIIRKQFRFEGSHIVRNCTSKRCSQNQHGHSFLVEVFFTAKGLDNGQMIMDFGLMKNTIGNFIDSFDHSYSLWEKESDRFKNFVHEFSNRVVTMPVSPSAESYALLFLYYIRFIMLHTEYNNGEQFPKCSSVRVHETATGYAEAFDYDLEMYPYKIEDCKFSDAIVKDWSEDLLLIFN